jgi:hypothetical protein
MNKKNAKRESATQSKDPAQLTDKQIESLMDDLLCASSHEAAVTNPLLIIMDEITRSPFDLSRVESIAATVKRYAYSRTYDADGQEERYIRQIRADALQAVA